jgi:hypothetical protein
MIIAVTLKRFFITTVFVIIIFYNLNEKDKIFIYFIFLILFFDIIFELTDYKLGTIDFLLF